MLSAMEQTPEGDLGADFLTTGRTGRRNALPDILAAPRTSTADLPDALAALSTHDEPGTSGTSNAPSTSAASTSSLPSSCSSAGGSKDLGVETQDGNKS